MASAAQASSIAPSTTEVLPLVAGDRLSRDEFERRYHATKGIKKAELIEGRVYLAPPVSIAGHSFPQANMLGWLANYAAATPGVRAGGEGSIRMDLDNMPQPDCFMLVTPECGGQARISEDDYLEGSPELIVEIAASSSSYDLHDKLHVYRRNGVKEYIVLRARNRAVDYFVLQDTQYVALQADDKKRYKSIVFPGLWLNTQAVLASDLPGMFSYLQAGIASPEHAEFIKRLKNAASQST